MHAPEEAQTIASCRLVVCIDAAAHEGRHACEPLGTCLPLRYLHCIHIQKLKRKDNKRGGSFLELHLDPLPGHRGFLIYFLLLYTLETEEGVHGSHPHSPMKGATRAVGQSATRGPNEHPSSSQ